MRFTRVSAILFLVALVAPWLLYSGNAGGGLTSELSDIYTTFLVGYTTGSAVGYTTGSAQGATGNAGANEVNYAEVDAVAAQIFNGGGCDPNPNGQAQLPPTCGILASYINEGHATDCCTIAYNAVRKGCLDSPPFLQNLYDTCDVSATHFSAYSTVSAAPFQTGTSIPSDLGVRMLALGLKGLQITPIFVPSSRFTTYTLYAVSSMMHYAFSLGEMQKASRLRSALVNAAGTEAESAACGCVSAASHVLTNQYWNGATDPTDPTFAVATQRNPADPRLLYVWNTGRGAPAAGEYANAVKPRVPRQNVFEACEAGTNEADALGTYRYAAELQGLVAALLPGRFCSGDADGATGAIAAIYMILLGISIFGMFLPTRAMRAPFVAMHVVLPIVTQSFQRESIDFAKQLGLFVFLNGASDTNAPLAVLEELILQLPKL